MARPFGPRANRDIVEWYSVPLGVGLYLDSLLGGGINGQALPLFISLVPAGQTRQLDVIA